MSGEWVLEQARRLANRDRRAVAVRHRDEIAQSAAVAGWEAISAGKSDLEVIEVMRRACEAARRRESRRESSASSCEPLPSVGHGAALVDLRSAIRNLPELLPVVLNLLAEGRTQTEIAGLMGWNRHKAGRAIAAGREALERAGYKNPLGENNS